MLFRALSQKKAPFAAADVRFLNAVANNVAINLQGTGASLQTFGEFVIGCGILLRAVLLLVLL